MHHASFYIVCIANFFGCLILSAFRRLVLDLQHQGRESRTQRLVLLSTISRILIIILGSIATVSLFLLPGKVAYDNPLALCVSRIICFFYGCKILHLAWTKAKQPPVLLHHGQPVDMLLMGDFLEYLWRLTTEMRYHSFDIAVYQKDRPERQPTSMSRPIAAAFLVGILAYFLPMLTELKCIVVLLLIQGSFETLHTILHPSCPHPLFFEPFSATSMSAFWTTHWQGCANPFLHSLAYRPIRELAGRAAGVLATFSLSGIWHGWASACLVEDDYATTMFSKVWGLFVLFGAVCLAERWYWGEKQGCRAQKIVVWSVAIVAAGRCFRELERHSKVESLRR